MPAAHQFALSRGALRPRAVGSSVLLGVPLTLTPDSFLLDAAWHNLINFL
jgi:hypothetical protein